MGQVVVQLVGEFSVTIDGAAVKADDFARRSGAELVQFLALAPGYRSHREQVAEALWPGTDLQRAVNRLHQAASHARKALGDSEAIVLRDQMVLLFPGRSIETDVGVIERIDLDNPRDIAAALHGWRGDLLADVPYADWAHGPRERLRQRRFELLRVTGRWRTLLELNPTDEAAYVALMNQALASGDTAEVTRLFDELGCVLAEQLAVEPGQAALTLAAKAKTMGASRDKIVASGLRAFIVADLDEPPRGSDELCHQLLTEAIEGEGGADRHVRS